MKSTIKLTLSSFILFLSFSTVQASTVETDTVMAQNYIETNRIVSNSVDAASIDCENEDVTRLYVHSALQMMPYRSTQSAGEESSPIILMYSAPYQTASTLEIGFENGPDPESDPHRISFTAQGPMGNGTAMNFHAAEYNFDFNAFGVTETGIMNVNGKIVCKEEIRVTEVNTDKINTKGINAKEINVEMGHAADYVFDEEYDLKSLGEVEEYVKKNKHLPGVPSASEFKENGMNVSETSNLLLEKIEELTLYMIRLQKEVEQLKEENNALRNGAKQ